MSDTETTLDVSGLDKMIKAMRIDPPKIRVGILGDSAVRKPEDGEKQTPSNAEIGTFHEFGTSTLPQRSFLRVPIAEHLQEKMRKAGFTNRDYVKETIASGTLIPFAQAIAAIAENCVQEAFDTGGYGKWKPSNMDNKDNAQTLVETSQLRGSITSEVKA